ncbi:MAG TPA: helix-turn-helix domain-containing protein [Phycisphaerales bacterium]|nr:helix-turn-helix domain-containing protein [Phycisphaerales bacterium]
MAAKGKLMIKRKDVLTTGQVAQICHVAPRTVTKWFDSGQLKGYRIPGSRDRRIPAGELIRFMKAHNMPTDELEKGHIRILLIDSRVEVARQLARDLQTKGSFSVEIAQNSFDAGLMAQKMRPNIILVELMNPDIDAHEMCSYVCDNEELKDCCVIALAGGLSSTEVQALLKQGFGGVVTEPVNINKILACIQEKCPVFY